MVRFYLDDKGQNEAPILVSLHHNGKRFKAFTGKKIAPDKWDSKSGRANTRKYKNNVIGFNKFLQTISDQIESFLNTGKPITKQQIREIIDKVSGKETTKTFFGFAADYIETQLAKGRMKAVSAKAYRGTLNHIRQFDSQLSFDAVDVTLYDSFVQYLVDQGLATNSIGAHIKRLKWFMSAGLERDLHNNVSFRKKQFAIQKEDTDSVYLTQSEIEKLQAVELPTRLRKVADAFIINCYLGIRYSDLSVVRKQNFTNQNDLYYLTMIQTKTNERVTIPVNPRIAPLLLKYDFECPIVQDGKLMSVQNFNKYIKEASEEAQISTQMTIRFKGKTTSAPKHSFVTSHTARRSFSTNLYLQGVSIQNIMAVTGHRKESTFLLYIRADQLTRAEGLANFYRSNQ